MPEILNVLSDDIGFVSLINRHKDAALSVVNSARVSYANSSDEYTDKDKRLAGFLREEGHFAPFRHQHYTFHIKAPLFVFRQWTKYTVGSTWRWYAADGVGLSLEAFDALYSTDSGTAWNEVSGRYTQTATEVYVPVVMRTNPPHGNKQSSVDLPDDFDHKAERDLMLAECEQALANYESRIKRGIAKEIARMTLPQNMYSQSYWTVSLQALLHFFRERLDDHAQWEIRQFARAVKDLIQDDLDRLGIEL